MRSAAIIALMLLLLSSAAKVKDPSGMTPPNMFLVLVINTTEHYCNCFHNKMNLRIWNFIGLSTAFTITTKSYRSWHSLTCLYEILKNRKLKIWSIKSCLYFWLSIVVGIVSSSVHIDEEHWTIFRWILPDWSWRNNERSWFCEY